MTATTPSPVDGDRRQQLIADRLRRARERRAGGDAVPGVDAPIAIVRDPDAPIELSSAQRRLWFLQQLDPSSTAYHVPLVYDLDGVVDGDRLERAWRAVVDRHEILRTRYGVLDGEPRATVDPAPAPQWYALRGAVGELTAKFVGRPFDLETEQPWRAALITEQGDGPLRHRLVLVLHHIACDGWSASVLLDDLAAAFRTGRLDPPGVQYADVVRARNAAATDDEVAYWVDHLAGAPLTLELPTDRPRPATADPAGAVVHVPVPHGTAAALRALTATTATTPFMAVLAALHVVLGRWSGVGDIVVGVPVADRDHPDLGRVVGCFANTVALRTTSTPDQSPRRLLDHVREVVVTGLAHQSVAFERVVDVVAPDRDISTTPVYQVSLTVHNEPGADLDLPGLRTAWVDELAPQAKVDLALHVHGDLVAGANGNGGPDGTITAVSRTSLFDEATVRRLVGHVATVIEEIAADPDRPLAHVRMLTDAEVAELPASVGGDVTLPVLASGGAGAAHAGGRDELGSVDAIVRDVARRHPDRIAVTSRGVDLTYRQLVDAADRTAAALAAAGVGRGDLVPLLAERSGDVIVGMLAAWTLGAAYVPIDPAAPDQRIAQVIGATGAGVALAQARLARRLPGGVSHVELDQAARGPQPDVPFDGAAATDLAYVLFTSGTTGAPKGVQVDHRNLLAYVAGLHGMVDIDVDAAWSWALMTTPSADLGLTNVLGALTTGGRLHVLTYEQVTDPEQVAGYFRQHGIDAVKLVPSQLQALWDDAHPRAVLPKRLLILAGEPCPWTLVDRIAEADPHLAVHNHYGPTETTVSTMGLHVGGPGSTRPGTGTIAPIGRPFPGTRAHVVDDLLRPLPTGVPGELVLAGPTVSRGYLGLPDQTAMRFVAEPRWADTDPPGAAPPAYRTGDRVRRLPGGEIEFLGRVDDQVKIRGFRVEPGDIAHAARRHPAVGDCTVIVREDRPGIRTLAAYVVPAAGDLGDVPIGDLRDHFRACLPDYMVPADIVPVAAIPLTANGKVDRAALPDPDPSTRAAAADRPPRGELEQRIAAVWCDVLDLGSVGATIDFFDAGGDSFSAVKIARALRHEVSVVDVFTHRTVASLAAALVEREGGAAAPTAGLLRRLDQGAVHPDVHIVCVPYGGGSPVTFAPLAAAVDATTAVHGVDLPGHDPSRPDESPRPIADVAADLVSEIAALDGDVVLYGHCLGGALAVETARQLERAGRPVTGVVAAGTFPAARLPGRLARLWHRLFPSDRWLSNRAYHDMLRSLGGFTDVVETADRDFLIRALRHDAREAEDYYTRHYETALDDTGDEAAAGQRLQAPMLCVVGARDRATELYEERFAEWEDFADDVDLAVIPDAGHYFLKHQAGELAAILGDRVSRWRRGERPRAQSPVAGAGAPNVSTFLLVAVTQLLSMIGTGLTSFGLGVWVLERTGSVSSFAMISVLALLPAILLMPVTGALADRVDRRRVMILADGAAGVATAVLVVLLATDRLDLWYVYLFATVGSVANAFQRPAYLAAITQLVPKQYLGQANGLIGLGLNGGDLIAAMLGGMLVGAFGMAAVVGIDVVTFATAFGVLLTVRFPDRLWVRLEESFVSEVTGGWRYIVRRRPLVVMVVFFVVFNLLFALPAVLATPLVLAEHGASVLGAVLACGGVGALAGALAMAVWGGTRRRAVGMVGGTVALGAGVIVLGSSASAVVQGVGMFVTYGSLLVLNAHWLALIQTKAGLELQGRVLAINQMLAMAAMPVGFLLSGPLSDWLGRRVADGAIGGLADVLPMGDSAGPALAILLAGAAIVVWGVAGLLTPSLRLMEDDLPDAIPDGVIAGSHDDLQAAADAALERHLAARR